MNFSGDTSDQEIRRYLQRFHPEQLQIDVSLICGIFLTNRFFITIALCCTYILFLRSQLTNILELYIVYLFKDQLLKTLCALVLKTRCREKNQSKQ